MLFAATIASRSRFLRRAIGGVDDPSAPTSSPIVQTAFGVTRLLFAYRKSQPVSLEPKQRSISATSGILEYTSGELNLVRAGSRRRWTVSTAALSGPGS
jgi:hypothetical protein